MGRGITRSMSLALTLAVSTALLGACNRQNNSGFRLTNDTSANSAASANATSGNPSVMPVASYADVVSKAAPAVVTIHSQMRVRQPQQYPFMDDPFFRNFFGDRAPQPAPEPRREGLGSGVIVRQDGYVLT